jgi:hypothetical protein
MHQELLSVLAWKSKWAGIEVAVLVPDPSVLVEELESWTWW